MINSDIDPSTLFFVLMLIFVGISICLDLNWTVIGRSLDNYRRNRVVSNRPGRGLHLLPDMQINTGFPDRHEPTQADVEEVMARISAPQPEEQSGELEAASIDNWNRLPSWRRVECVKHLRNLIGCSPDGKNMLNKWKEQKAKGLRIGCDEFGFHFGTGMWVRNVLREKMRDDHLPFVEYESGEKYQNWDDFYYGAIDELAGSL